MAQLVIAPSDVLSKKAFEVKKIDPSVKKTVADMKEALLSVKDIIGVGIAAPQIGIPLRIFLMKPTEKAKIQTIINPVVTTIEAIPQNKKARSRKVKLEGCLSLPNIWGTVARSTSLTLSYLDEEGKSHEKAFKGFTATIVQHEIDHLEGILFPRRVLEQKGTLYQSHKNKKGEDIFDEIEI